MFIFKPRRGTKSKAISSFSSSSPLQSGEIFFEIPDNGVGKGAGKIKMGDGSTAYDKLPYFLDMSSLDLSNYYSKSQVDNLLNGYLESSGRADKLSITYDNTESVKSSVSFPLSNSSTFYTTYDLKSLLRGISDTFQEIEDRTAYENGVISETGGLYDMILGNPSLDSDNHWTTLSYSSKNENMVPVFSDFSLRQATSSTYKYDINSSGIYFIETNGYTYQDVSANSENKIVTWYTKNTNGNIFEYYVSGDKGNTLYIGSFQGYVEITASLLDTKPGALYVVSKSGEPTVKRLSSSIDLKTKIDAGYNASLEISSMKSDISSLNSSYSSLSNTVHDHTVAISDYNTNKQYFQTLSSIMIKNITGSVSVDYTGKAYSMTVDIPSDITNEGYDILAVMSMDTNNQYCQIYHVNVERYADNSLEDIVLWFMNTTTGTKSVKYIVQLFCMKDNIKTINTLTDRYSTYR